ncbi:DEAD/DEAH box helicase [Gottfriedia acidiceleris]|uniref:DEAD/DEAH box helicase n=1 Tax=Gottfriedia acidiceleris TaxID=371036 RepID=UPI0013EB4F8A|nr:DEAD/DEAH box helicase [Gottfriedia acidiceleris]
MYNKFTQDLIDKIPELEGFNSVSCRRILTKAYLSITQLKVGINQQEILNEELIETRDTLRRLADAMESFSIFDKLNGLDIPEDVEVSCAFVAAEALSLLNTIANLLSETDEVYYNDHFFYHKNYIALESALLYMVGGFDINANSMIDLINYENFNELNDGDYLDLNKSSILLINSLKTFINGKVSNFQFSSNNLPKILFSEPYNELVEKIRIHFYIQLSVSINQYISWLNGDDQDGLKNSLLTLTKVRKASSSESDSRNIAYSDIYHFSSLLAVAIEKTQLRSLFNTIPVPESDDAQYQDGFQNYLKSRAKGTGFKLGRPFLWPSALSYVNQCLPGPKRDCVVTMPTGSGKSFIAEIAMIHALSKGWVLYLAPTNALVHQIRRDLKDTLSNLHNTKIRSFVGGEEYTTLSEENIDFEERFVAVMTPEKCALAIRLYPEQFKNCSLCIFDECHLINDKNRGTNADILLTRLIEVAENIKFLLMSAMISNGEELSNWLKKVHDKDAICEPINWRPSRTLRSVAALNLHDIREKFPINKEKANKLSGNKKYVYFDCSLLLISGLSGPWTLDSLDYKVSKIPVSFRLKASKDNSSFLIESWKNTVSRNVSEQLANSGIPVINFILTSKHHAFSSAGKINERLAGSCGSIEHLPEMVKDYLTIADKELGLRTVLWDLFAKGIAVHSSSMLQVEQSASEYIFTNEKASLMFATGTLAQGLNLPAVAVVVAGTTMGDPRESDDLYGITNERAKSTILNAFGRAGRPSFGNQGLAILVPDNPPIVNYHNIIRPIRIQGNDIMSEQDASVVVHSPIENFIDLISNEQYNIETATIEELTLTSLLAELDNENNISSILSKTFGVFNKGNLITEKMLEIARQRILKIKKEFLDTPSAPEWINLATMKAGVDFFRAQGMWEAYLKRGLIIPEAIAENNVMDWLSVFFDVLSRMHPRFIKFYPTPEIRTKTPLTRMRDYVVKNNLFANEDFEVTPEWKILWEELEQLFRLYMNGASYKTIAERLLGMEVRNNGRSSGSNPIPAVFKFIKDVIEPIAVDAGCFLALNELGVFNSEGDSVPEGLQALPIAIRNGCNNLGTLAWFRFGFRQRICAHYLEEAFPVPNEIIKDQERADWVRRTRRNFLSTPSEQPFLESIRNIIIQET